MLTPGDPAPWFEGRSSLHPQSSFATRAGRYVVLCFFGSSTHPPSRRILDEIEKNHARFDMQNACFCGVSVDPDDERLERLRQQWPGIIYFWDFDSAISRLYGAATPGSNQYVIHTLVLDPALRTIAFVPITGNGEGHVQSILQMLDRQPPVTARNNIAPVLAIPYVFEPDFCRSLIDFFKSKERGEGGVLQDVGGKTVDVVDHRQKQRTDCYLSDQSIIAPIHSRLQRRAFPEIKKAFQFDVTHVERYLICCYDAQSGGHFRAHRDNTTKGSAHRRFALTLNLNAEEYEGGDLRFPEFGSGRYRAPTGGAIVFSCALLHEVMPITRGQRFAFLPFLFDDAAAKIREQNQQFLAPQPAA